MNENKEIDISTTILNTIKILEEKLIEIKQLDIKTYEEMRKKLDEIYEASKNKTLNVIETVNLLMKLQNDTIAFLDTYIDENTMSLQIYNPPTQNPIKRFFIMIKNKIMEISKFRHNKTVLETANIDNKNE